MPAEPVIKPRYFKDLISWAPRQNDNYEDLVTRGICLTRDYVIVSSLQQATDYSEGTMPTFDWKSPAPLLYSRPSHVTAAYALGKISDFTQATLPSNIKVLPDHLGKLSRS